MSLLKKLFPLSFRSMTPKRLILTVLLYMAINMVCALVIGVLTICFGSIPLLGTLLSLLSALPATYTLVGVVLVCLHMFGIV